MKHIALPLMSQRVTFTPAALINNNVIIAYGSVWKHLDSKWHPTRELIHPCSLIFHLSSPIMAGIILSMFFSLLFRNICTESLSFYFSIYENRALNITGSNLIRSSSEKDTMLCTRACATQINCQTAIFHYIDEKKCELYEKRTEDILNDAMVVSEGHHLITKVRIQKVF